MMRHEISHIESWGGQSRAEKFWYSLVIIFFGSVFSLLTLGLILQAIFSDLNDGSPMHPATYVGTFMPPVLALLWLNIGQVFHVYHGLNGRQTSAYCQYRLLSERAKSGLPAEKFVRKAISEANHAESDMIYDKFRDLQAKDNSLVYYENQLGPVIKNAMVEALVNDTEDAISAIEILAEETRRLE